MTRYAEVDSLFLFRTKEPTTSLDILRLRSGQNGGERHLILICESRRKSRWRQLRLQVAVLDAGALICRLPAFGAEVTQKHSHARWENDLDNSIQK